MDTGDSRSTLFGENNSPQDLEFHFHNLCFKIDMIQLKSKYTLYLENLHQIEKEFLLLDSQNYSIFIQHYFNVVGIKAIFSNYLKVVMEKMVM